ncbi:MAG: alpha/beta fold hydrolase [Sandaracinaceae bacterium]
MSEVVRDTLQVDGKAVTLHRNRGEGPRLVLLHGAGGNGGIWAPVLPHLDGFAAVAPSLPGRDGSEGQALGSAGQAAAWVGRLVTAVGGGPAIVVGHSYGGAIALELAFGGAALRGLVLACSGARLRVHPRILEAARDAMRTGEGLSLGFAFAPGTPASVVEAYEAAVARTPPAAALADWASCHVFDRMADLERVTVPALMVCGSEDELTPVKYHRFLATALPRGAMVEMAGHAHMLPFEAPVAFAAEVRRWADGLG